MQLENKRSSQKDFQIFQESGLQHKILKFLVFLATQD